MYGVVRSSSDVGLRVALLGPAAQVSVAGAIRARALLGPAAQVACWIQVAPGVDRFSNEWFGFQMVSGAMGCRCNSSRCNSGESGVGACGPGRLLGLRWCTVSFGLPVFGFLCSCTCQVELSMVHNVIQFSGGQ